MCLQKATVRDRSSSTPRRSSPPDFARTDRPGGPVFHLETAAKLLKLLEGVLSIFSKFPLKSLNNQADFDSAIRRFDPSRPSQSREGTPQALVKQEASRQTRSLSSNKETARRRPLCSAD